MTDIIDLTAEVVAAYFANASVSREDVPAFIRAVYDAFSKPVVFEEHKTALRGEPAVDPEKSVFDDVIISLEDGRPYKMLKRHLTVLGMTPEQYRAKWGLPTTYPMVAPKYSEKRSQVAKEAGLGRKLTSDGENVVTPIARPRGRPRKAA